MESQELLNSPLADKHAEHEASMTEEAGWNMPLSFSGAIQEAAMTHTHGATMDLSNIGRLRIRGNEAVELLERVCTADVVHQEDNTAQHTLLCTAQGGILDQCQAIRLDDYWILTTSACNRLKVLEHLKNEAEAFDVTVDDQTLKTAFIAVAGPHVQATLGRVLPIQVADLTPGTVKMGSLLIAKYLAICSTRLGVWTLEVMLPKMIISKAWRYITDKAGDDAFAPAGLAAGDILRIEAGQLRYGHELNETIDPFTAGLGGEIDFGHEFVGKRALEELKAKEPARKLAGLILDSADSIAKLGDLVTLCNDGTEIGTVTSGTFSPECESAIAMAYVLTGQSDLGTEVLVSTNSGSVKGTITALPFGQS